MTGIIVSASTVSQRRNNISRTMSSSPLKRTGLRPSGPPSRRTKQVSHESTSSFFTTVTTASSTSAGGENVTTTTVRRQIFTTTPLPATAEQNHDDSPKRTVHHFIAFRQAGNIEAAAALLDAKVQVSYPHQPYGKTVADWKRLASVAAIDANHAWQVLQTGAHAAQVVRRGSVRGRREAVLEVFELHQNGNSDDWVIGAMYLRRAPRQWTFWGGAGKNKKRQLRNNNNNKSISKENRLSIPSQRLQREMLQGDSSDHEYYYSGDSHDAYDSYYDSSENYYSYAG